MKKVLIGILIGLIVGLGCLFVYNEFFLKNNDATKTDKKEAVKKEEVKEEKITDETIIKQLNENVGILSNYCYAGSKMCIENLYEEDKVTYISDIDKAIHLQPNNFSVKNARAIILF